MFLSHYACYLAFALPTVCLSLANLISLFLPFYLIPILRHKMYHYSIWVTLFHVFYHEQIPLLKNHRLKTFLVRDHVFCPELITQFMYVCHLATLPSLCRACNHPWNCRYKLSHLCRPTSLFQIDIPPSTLPFTPVHLIKWICRDRGISHSLVHLITLSCHLTLFCICLCYLMHSDFDHPRLE